MHFVSFSFAALFAVALLARFTIGRTKQERGYLAVLLALSVLFYAWHVPVYVVLIVSSTVVDYLAGLALGRPQHSDRARKGILCISLAVNLGLLGFFKYANFFIEEVNGLLVVAGLEPSLPVLDVLLPMGISFYTFQSLSYTIDVYRRVVEPTPNFFRFFLFVSFFPQLVAGPIVRAKEFLYQFDRPRRIRTSALSQGMYLLIRGYFLKMVLADNIGTVVDANWDASAEPGVGAAGVAFASLLFSFQVYCDFAGYSSIARGLAYFLGFRLPVNFNSPFIAPTFSNFWRRWHISLSRWLTDYLYVPLGGNRKGTARVAVNLFIVMFLSGLWHGAGTHFLLWGAIHGTALLTERFLGLQHPMRHNGKPRKVPMRVAWFLVVQLTFAMALIFFRSPDIEQALAMAANLFTLDWAAQGPSMARFPILLCLAFLVPAALMQARTFVCERGWLPWPSVREKSMWAGLMLYFVITSYSASDAFVYFAF